VEISYNLSKAALNLLTLEFARVFPTILFQATNPGHCKTDFNGHQGAKDPKDGAEVIVQLALCEREKYGMGFWMLDSVEEGPKPMAW
jgi:NAD(P)-dependent dehydrogenase (short-subunit alcohol dehydrogenase family)